MSDWLPVTRADPCAICHHATWCLVAPDGVAHLCNRVASNHPAKGGGWIHGTPRRLDAPIRHDTPKTAYDPPTFDAGLWWRTGRYLLARQPYTLTPWADSLGVSADALAWMGATTICRMLCFPMHDGTGAVCGIRTRTPDGAKRAITGSKAGVFLPTVRLPDLEVVICEGPTDAAAALDLGFEPLGRPSCIGQEQHVLETLRRWGCEQVTICVDNDGPGVAGANRLAEVLRVMRVRVRIVAPVGHKDLRDWLRAGATPEHVNAAWSQQAWR